MKHVYLLLGRLWDEHEMRDAYALKSDAEYERDQLNNGFVGNSVAEYLAWCESNGLEEPDYFYYVVELEVL